MKLCITSQGDELSADVDPRFGRAPYFIIYDDETKEHEVVNNEQKINAGGRGTEDWLSRARPEAFPRSAARRQCPPPPLT